MPAAARTDRFVAQEHPPELQVTRARGSYLYDANGRKYIDFLMGWCVGNLGWGNPEIEARARRFRGPDYIYPGYFYRPWRELAELLVSIAPGRMKKCLRATGGSESVDIALQAALVHSVRRNFVSLEDSYHGNTIGALSVGASETREKCPNLLEGCAKVPARFDDRTLGSIETRLKRRDVAAFIMEPIVMNLGVLIPPPFFMTRLQGLCRRYGTLLIMDEVATGFGRTGRIFATEHYGIEPDIVCFAKAVTGGVGGMGGVLVTADVASSMEENGSFYSTYGWHPRSVDVAIATVRYMVRHKSRLLGHVEAMSEYFAERLGKIDFSDYDEPPAIRIQGLAIGIDFHDEDAADEVETSCRRAGLLVSTEGTTVLLLPALNVARSVASRALDIFAECV